MLTRLAKRKICRNKTNHVLGSVENDAAYSLSVRLALSMNDDARQEVSFSCGQPAGQGTNNAQRQNKDKSRSIANDFVCHR